MELFFPYVYVYNTGENQKKKTSPQMQESSFMYYEENKLAWQTYTIFSSLQLLMA